jgi:hypothetical protein
MPCCRNRLRRSRSFARFARIRSISCTTSFSFNPAALNELYYYPASVTSLNPYASDSTTDSTFNYGHSLAYCTGSPCNLMGHLYNSGSFSSDPGNISGQDPLFVNYSGGDYGLQAGSPAIAKGTYLTTVASGDSGSGTSLVVTDAGYFQDGYGITGVNGDCISVTTVGNHCVTAVNYSTKTLALTSGITRSSGDPVWLYSDSTGRQVLFGSAPNIGATFAGSTPVAPAPPTLVTAVVQ